MENKHVCKKCQRELSEGSKKDLCEHCQNKGIGKFQNFCKGAATVVGACLTILFLSNKK